MGCPARRACQRGLWSEAAEKLSIAAEAWDDVSAAMDRAGAEMGRWLAENTFTLVRVDGVDRWVHVDSVEVATVRHRTSRAGDPHRHVHYQISSRVHAAGR